MTVGLVSSAAIIHAMSAVAKRRGRDCIHGDDGLSYRRAMQLVNLRGKTRRRSLLSFSVGDGFAIVDNLVSPQLPIGTTPLR